MSVETTMSSSEQAAVPTDLICTQNDAQKSTQNDDWMDDAVPSVTPKIFKALSSQSNSPKNSCDYEEGEIEDDDWIGDDGTKASQKAIPKTSIQMAAYKNQQQQRKNRKKERKLRIQQQKKQQQQIVKKDVDRRPSQELPQAPKSEIVAPKTEMKLMSLLEGMSKALVPPLMLPQSLLKIDTEAAPNTLLDLIKTMEPVVSEKENKPAPQVSKIAAKRKIKDVDKEPSKKQEKKRKFVEMMKDKAKREAEWKDKMSETVCRFYMEGRCTKGDECSFSHKATPVAPPKKPELCKYYLSGYCVKSDKCQFMHAEFPCKFHHVAGLKCLNGDKCRFSHATPMNETVRDAFERYVNETGGGSIVSAPVPIPNGDSDARVAAPLLSLMDLPIPKAKAPKTVSKPASFFVRDIDERGPVVVVATPMVAVESRDIDERSVSAPMQMDDPSALINKLLLSTLVSSVPAPVLVSSQAMMNSIKLTAQTVNKDELYQEENDEYLRLDIDENAEMDSSMANGDFEWQLVPIDVEPSKLWTNPPVLANTNKNSVDQECDPRVEFYSNKINNPLSKVQKPVSVDLSALGEVNMNGAYAAASTSSALSPPQTDSAVAKKKTVDPRLASKPVGAFGADSSLVPEMPTRDVLQSKPHNGAQVPRAPQGETGTVRLSIDDYKRKLQKPALVASSSSLFYNPNKSGVESAPKPVAAITTISTSYSAPKPPSYSVNLLDPLGSFSNEPQSLLDMLKNFPSS